jgi:hypothetical protein
VDLITTTWNTWVVGTYVYILEENLSMVKLALRQWEKCSSIPLATEKVKIKNKLEEIQMNLEYSAITAQNYKEEFTLLCSYQNVFRREEELWSLKSHSFCLQTGDKNTKYFHNQAKY